MWRCEQNEGCIFFFSKQGCFDTFSFGKYLANMSGMPVFGITLRLILDSLAVWRQLVDQLDGDLNGDAIMMP